MDVDLADLNWPALLVAGGGVVLAFYLLIPWLIYATQRMKGDPEIVQFDPEESPPPKRVARYLDEAAETLFGLGYEPSPCVALPDPMPNVRAITQLWIHPERKDAALVSAIFGISHGASQQMFYTEFLSRFANDELTLIMTNNARTISAFAGLPNERTFRFPMVQSIGELERLHRQLLLQHAPSTKKLVSLHDTFHGDLESYIRWAITDSYRKQEGTGYLVHHEAGNYWRPTVKGAYLMTWSQLWPMSMVLKANRNRQARQLLRELAE